MVVCMGWPRDEVVGQAPGRDTEAGRIVLVPLGTSKPRFILPMCGILDSLDKGPGDLEALTQGQGEEQTLP